MTHSSSKNKKVIFLTSLIILLIVATVLSVLSIKRNHEYNNAIELLNDEKPVEAALIFKNLNDYKDSKNYLTECNHLIDYYDGIDAFSNENYPKAASIFEDLENYKDSENYYALCTYAISYSNALNEINKEEYTAAWNTLNQIETDAATNNIDIAIVLDYNKFTELKDECYKYICYENALEYYNNGNYYYAYTWFNSSDGILDSQQLSKDCIRPFKTEELYFDPLFFWYTLELNIKVNNEHTSNVCIKIYAKDTLVTVVTIKPGQLKRVELPSGYYSFKKAEGTDWFGNKDYFGVDGSYSIFIFDEDIRGDVNEDYEIHLQDGYSHTIEIGYGEGGNITTFDITYEDFKD